VSKETAKTHRKASVWQLLKKASAVLLEAAERGDYQAIEAAIKAARQATRQAEALASGAYAGQEGKPLLPKAIRRKVERAARVLDRLAEEVKAIPVTSQEKVAKLAEKAKRTKGKEKKPL